MAISTIPCPPQAGASWKSVLAMERPLKQMRSPSSWQATWKASSPPSMCNPDGDPWGWWNFSGPGQRRWCFITLCLCFWGRWWTITPTWFHSWSTTQRPSTWFRISWCEHRVLFLCIYRCVCVFVCVYIYTYTHIYQLDFGQWWYSGDGNVITMLFYSQ